MSDSSEFSKMSADISGNKSESTNSSDLNDVFPNIPFAEALFELICVFSVLYLPYILKMLVVGVDMSKYSQSLGAEQYMAILSQGILASVIIGFILYKNRQPVSSIGLHARDFVDEISVAIISFLGILAVVFFVGVLASFVFKANQVKEINSNDVQIANMFASIPVWAIPLFCIFVGYYEELVFRGFFITRLRCILRNDWLAVIVSSAFFASAHFYEGIFKMIMIFGLACFLGGVFVIRRSLIAPIIIHTLFDFTFIMLAKFASEFISG